MDYSNLKNLILKAKNKDQSAMEELINEYKYLIIKEASKVHVRGYEMEDLIQMGNITLMRCLEKYTLEKGNFTAYISYAIKNNFNYLIRQRAKDNEVQTIEAPIETNLRIEDTLIADASTEDSFIEKEMYKLIKREVDNLQDNLRDLITFIYINCEGNLKDYSKSRNLNYSTAAKRRTVALNKLRSSLNSLCV
ncbi:sigma-70 family RNA polymerase sigma factor [uncultured Clostridium sp.]|uniref:sigma-70 family RNA polymerase sigma factor n=1 Tax=uncultured Clostridium sp. TaxID=59620 RepID=UPI003217D48F